MVARNRLSELVQSYHPVSDCTKDLLSQGQESIA